MGIMDWIKIRLEGEILILKVTIICGFLGAGKTTFLKRLLQENAEKTAVLVNEFGEVGIDGELLSASSSNVDIIELPNGCICCSLKSSLVKAIIEINQLYQPERLIIEPSGLSAPSSIVSTLQDPKIASWVELTAVIGIIDGPSFLEDWNTGNFGRFFRDQVTNSDLLLINKTDLMSDDLLQETIILVTTLNPVALIYPTKFCSAELPPVTGHQVGEHHHFRADLDSLSLTITGEVPYSVLSTLPGLLEQNYLGNIVRAKGILQTEQGWENFDYVNGRWNITPYPGTLDIGKAVFIGKALKKSLLAELFSALVIGVQP